MSQLSMEEFYRQDAYQGFGGNFHPEHFSEYVNFVKFQIGKQKVFEIGSGLGAAAFSLYVAGVEVVATDIYPNLCKRQFANIGVEIPVLELDAVKNSLPNSSVENYSLYQVLEHISQPIECLRECYRTLSSGGKIIIVSPNLLSPLASGKALVMGILQKWKTPFLFRNDGYTYPYGSTIVEIFLFMLRNLFIFLKIYFFSLARYPRFRVPCLKKPAISDSDAIFFTEPLTIKKILEDIGFEIISFQECRKSRELAGSVWIVAKKPG